MKNKWNYEYKFHLEIESNVSEFFGILIEKILNNYSFNWNKRV